MLVKEANQVTGGLSNPDKMPGFAYNLPAWECNVGNTLNKQPGSICEDCYARKGRYIFPGVRAAMYRRLDCMKKKLWVKAMAFLINRYWLRKEYDVFRWHDSGDLQSEEHLGMICAVCELTPTVKHWLPTKEVHIIRRYRKKHVVPDNLTIRPSAFYVNEMPTGAVEDLPFSTVHTKGEEPENAHLCPAKQQGGKCGNCRACWDRGVPWVSYPKT